MTDTADSITSRPNFGSGQPSHDVVARLAATPGIQRVPSPKLTLFLRRNFLDAATCQAVCDRIDAIRRPSTLSDHNGDPTFRTSETCDLDSNDPVVAAVENAILDLTGLDGRYGEPMQGQRYAVGQEFKQHTDYFEPAGVDYERYCGVGGNRTQAARLLGISLRCLQYKLKAYRQGGPEPLVQFNRVPESQHPLGV